MAGASSEQNFDYIFKILLIGNSPVGKTSFMMRFCDDTFTSSFVSTVGIDFKVKTVVRGDKKIKLQIWVCTHLPFSYTLLLFPSLPSAIISSFSLHLSLGVF